MDRENIEVSFDWSDEALSQLGDLGKEFQKIKDAAMNIEKGIPGTKVSISIKLTIPSPEIELYGSRDEEPNA